MQVRVRVDDGVELEVRVEGDGPGLLLVHGFGGAKEDFADHVDVLAATHRVVTFDHRGHGGSDKPHDPHGYTFERLRADVVAVADTVGLDRFRLLGHSLGGMIARGVALGYPERVEALVLMDTTHGPIPGFAAELMDAAAQVAIEQGKAALKELLDLAAPLETPAYLRLLETRPGYRDFCDRKWDAISERMWAGLARAIAYQEEELHRLAGLCCPTLVLVGEHDESFVKPCRRMASTIPGARLAVIPDAGHSPQFENPEVWLAELGGFLDALPVADPR